MKWNEEIEDKILERLAEGESLVSICSDEEIPGTSTVFRHLEEDERFRDRYARARETQADVLFDEILEIADDARNDWMERQGKDAPGWELNGEHLQRSRLRIDARKWMAGKLRPKKYGEKTVIGGDDTMDPIKTDEVGAGVRLLKAMVDGIAERNRETGEPSGE